MLRPAAPADLLRLLAIRDASGADALTDPALVGADGLARLIAADAVAAWEEDGRVMGFSAVDGGAIHLLVDAACRGNGVGRALLAAALLGVDKARYVAATLSLPAGGSAERHYRAAGWTDAGPGLGGGVVLKTPL